jgi:hypothetical protein
VLNVSGAGVPAAVVVETDTGFTVMLETAVFDPL